MDVLFLLTARCFSVYFSSFFFLSFFLTANLETEAWQNKELSKLVHGFAQYISILPKKEKKKKEKKKKKKKG